MLKVKIKLASHVSCVLFKKYTIVDYIDKPPETPIPPAVSDLRTEEGRVLFPTLLLPAAPPMYRPFMVLDEMESGKRSKSRLSKKESGTIHFICNTTEYDI